MKTEDSLNLCALPEETLLHTLYFLKTKSLARMASTCRFFNRLANDEYLDLCKERKFRLKKELWGKLMMAARHNELKTVKKILNQGIIDPTDQTMSSIQNTPLHAAIEGRAYKTAYYLWKNYNFDANAKDYYQNSPLSLLKKRSIAFLEQKEKKQVSLLLKCLTDDEKKHNKCIVC
ncbi:F-box-like domain-containing protein [Legionella cardiaca]|uniref:F-box-like domain-containing protein n=1 Tax=Legionella cardiaca TaxID=1071983 RepID=A0ABY8ARC7_9GAMM|nr:F-box-like domain-containing protein [Legionella cardiaca]WED41826.1 F-box-like domain-containing protein [Legionella cardiaca]